MWCLLVESQGAMETLRLITLLLQWNTDKVFGRIERRQNMICAASFAMLTVCIKVSDIIIINYHKPLLWQCGLCSCGGLSVNSVTVQDPQLNLFLSMCHSSAHDHR